MLSVPGFNLSGVDRRRWQAGGGEYLNNSFWMTVPMFIRKSDGEKKPAPPDHLHPWVLQAAKRSRLYRVNPARPSVRGVQNGKLCEIAKCTPNTLQRGDAVAIRFTVSYFEGMNDWYPQYNLLDVVRVCSAPAVTPAKEKSPEIDIRPVIRVVDTLYAGEIVDGELRLYKDNVLS